MITTSDTVAIQPNTIVRYAAPRIRVEPRYHSGIQIIGCDLLVLDSNENIVGSAYIELSPGTLDATVQTATGYVAKFQGAAEEAVKDYLESLTENSGATFNL